MSHNLLSPVITVSWQPGEEPDILFRQVSLHQQDALLHLDKLCLDQCVPDKQLIPPLFRPSYHRLFSDIVVETVFEAIKFPDRPVGNVIRKTHILCIEETAPDDLNSDVEREVGKDLDIKPGIRELFYACKPESFSLSGIAIIAETEIDIRISPCLPHCNGSIEEDETDAIKAIDSFDTL